MLILVLTKAWLGLTGIVIPIFMKRLIAATLMFFLTGSTSPLQAQPMIVCFENNLCVDFNSFKFSVSKVPGAPKYEVSTFRGIQTYSNGKNETIMEIDCREQSFRTVKIKEGKRWHNFDPRWGPRLEDEDRLLQMACEDRD